MLIKRRPFVAWLLVYSALAIAVTWPLTLRLTSTVASDLGDPLMSVSLLWWNAHVLPLTERWWNGFAFFPTTGMLAFSDHRLGEGLIATPLQWLGCSPSTAYNLTLLATFPLCAIAAHGLAFVLTRRHDAAAICGLAYGFNPYRMAHLAHLELLASFGMPVALAALHLALTTRRPRWMVVFTGALVVQGLCTSYYIAFFAILLGLWLLWFVRRRDAWLLPYIAAAGVCLGAVLLPLALAYARIHNFYGMSRDIGEVLAFSADVTGLFTANRLSALWGWTWTLTTGEGQIFPGLWITVLALVGVVVAMRERPIARDRRNWLALALGAVAVVYTLVACGAAVIGPWRVQLGPLKLGADVFFKPLSVALAAAVLAVAASSRARDAWTRRSLLAFYVTATGALFICSFGPRPTFLGHQVLYEPPYAWLMNLPIFSTEIRAPARIATLATLTLSVAGALAFDRLGFGRAARRAVAAVLMAGIVADGTIRGFAMPALPKPLPAEHLAGFDTVIELPLGDGDASAMYRAIVHGRSVVNGTSGYLPSSYEAMAAAMHEQDASVLEALPAGRLVIAVNRETDPNGFWRTTLSMHPRATRLGGDEAWSFFTLAPADVRPPCQAAPLPIVRASDERGDVDVRILTDADPATLWSRPSQRADDRLVLDLGRPVTPCALLVSLGRFAFAFPRKLSIATSMDQMAWTTVFNGSPAAETVRAALEKPKDVWLPFALPSTATRFVRIQLEASQSAVPWQVTDVVVRGRAESSP